MVAPYVGTQSNIATLLLYRVLCVWCLNLQVVQEQHMLLGSLLSKLIIKRFSDVVRHSQCLPIHNLIVSPMLNGKLHGYYSDIRQEKQIVLKAWDYKWRPIILLTNTTLKSAALLCAVVLVLGTLHEYCIRPQQMCIVLYKHGVED